jgi:hypothetical protein
MTRMKTMSRHNSLASKKARRVKRAIHKGDSSVCMPYLGRCTSKKVIKNYTYMQKHGLLPA